MSNLEKPLDDPPLASRAVAEQVLHRETQRLRRAPLVATQEHIAIAIGVDREAGLAILVGRAARLPTRPASAQAPAFEPLKDPV